MRISDWSSDVCSSDLALPAAQQPVPQRIGPQPDEGEGPGIAHHGPDGRGDDVAPDAERQQGRQPEMQADERGEGDCRHTGKAGRYAEGRARPAPKPVCARVTGSATTAPRTEERNGPHS